MAGCLQKCCGASTALTEWAMFFFGQSEGYCCHRLVTTAGFAVVHRQMALSDFEPFLKLWISHPKLADRFIFHYIIPADTTNALRDCL